MAIGTEFHKGAIFFDKDGTLVENIPYNIDPNKISFTPGTDRALALLKEFYQFHVVSNQAGIALGMFEEEDLAPVKKRIREMFSEFGAELKDFHYCPHHPEGNISSYTFECDCRKPGSLMLETAAQIHYINLNASWMIGDILDDVEAGKRAGCRTIFLDVGNETEWLPGEFRVPDYIVNNLEEAALLILSNRSIKI